MNLRYFFCVILKNCEHQKSDKRYFFDAQYQRLFSYIDMINYVLLFPGSEMFLRASSALSCRLGCTEISPRETIPTRLLF